MARRSKKEISTGEAQLETVLNHVRKHSVTMPLPDALRQRITTRLSMAEEDVAHHILAVYDVVEYSLAELIWQSLSGARADRLLTGFVYLWLRYCSVTKRGCSEHEAYEALVKLYTAEEILKLLQKYRLRAAGAPPPGSEQIHKTLAELQHSISEKTAGRYEDKARLSLINFLSDCLPDLSGLITGQSAGETIMPSPCASTDLASLLHGYTRTRCAASPATFGIRIPISECISRRVRRQGEKHAISSEHLPNYLFKRCTTVAGLPGSGLTTLLMQIALTGNDDNVNACHFLYASLSEYTDYMRKGYSVAQFVAAGLDADAFERAEQRLQLVAQIEQALMAGTLVILADEFHCLPDSFHEAVVAEFAAVKSVCFAVSKSGAAELHLLISRYINRDILRISLDDLDWEGQERIARLASIHMHVPYPYLSIPAVFDGWNRTEGTTPMGVLAALKTQGAPVDVHHLLFAQALLNEHLRRRGYPALILPQQACDLDDFALSLIRLGGAAIAETVSYLPEPFDPKTNVRSTLPLYEDVLQDIPRSTLDDLLRRMIICRQRSEPCVQFVFPCIEELCMTLYYYYMRGGRRLKREFFLPGGNTPVIRRAQQSSAFVPRLIACQSAQ